MKRLTINTIPLIAAGILAFSAPAKSSDLLDGLNDPAPQGATVNYTGPYILLGTGYAAGWNQFQEDLDGGNNGEVIDVALDGFFATGRLGYDFQFERTVIGAFADVNWDNLDANSIETAEFNYAAGLRLGHIVGGANLIYVNGGLEFGNDSDIDLEPGGNGEFSSYEFDRYFVGAGLESQIGGGFSLGVEGRYAWSDNETAPSGINDGVNGGSSVESSEISAMLYLKKTFGDF